MLLTSDELPASRGQPRSPSEVVERVWRATRSKGGDRDGAANLEVVLLTVSAAGSPQNWPGRTSATHLRAAPLNFLAADRTRAQEAYPVYVVRRESLVHSKDRFEWSLRPVEWSP